MRMCCVPSFLPNLVETWSFQVDFFSTQVSPVSQVVAGAAFSAALTQDGTVFVWGRNDQGQLGLGDESMGDMYSAERDALVYPPYV
jgi:alpha-tubulin suppressor-like RCC1 family protein